MSESGQEEANRHPKLMSAYRPKADIYFVKLKIALSMSAFRPKGDVNQRCSKLPFLANSGSPQSCELPPTNDHLTIDITGST